VHRHEPSFGPIVGVPRGVSAVPLHAAGELGFDLGGGTEAEMALSTNRRTLDGDREFEQLSNRLLQVKP